MALLNVHSSIYIRIVGYFFSFVGTTFILKVTKHQERYTIIHIPKATFSFSYLPKNLISKSFNVWHLTGPHKYSANDEIIVILKALAVEGNPFNLSCDPHYPCSHWQMSMIFKGLTLNHFKKWPFWMKTESNLALIRLIIVSKTVNKLKYERVHNTTQGDASIHLIE